MKFKIIIAFTFLHFNVLVKASETYQATTQLNIRSGTGRSFDVVGSIDQGEKVLIDTIIAGWGQIVVDGQPIGFAAMKYLSTNFKAYSSNSKDAKNGKSLLSTVSSILIFLVIIYYQFFGKRSSKSKSSPVSKRKEKGVNRFLEIKSGNVLHRKEGSTGFNTVYSGGDAVNFDLEDKHEERTRFLVVTGNGDVLLCKTHNTGKECVYRAFDSFEHSHKANFLNSDSFIFHTNKGTFKGYFNSTRKERLN